MTDKEKKKKKKKKLMEFVNGAFQCEVDVLAVVVVVPHQFWRPLP